MEVSKETLSSRFKVGDKVINLNEGNWGNEYGLMTIISIDRVGDVWCTNETIHKTYPHHGICQTPRFLTLATELAKALL